MKKLIYIFCLLLITLSLKAGLFEQSTNSFYKQGEFNIEFAPTMTSQQPFSFNKNVERTYGYSLETEFWQTKNTGTGVEIGLADSRDIGECGGIGHLSVMEDIRVISFDKTKFFNRFAIELKLGTGTDFINGEKYIQIGPGFDYQINDNFRAQIYYTQNYYTEPNFDSGTFRFGLQYIF